MTGPRRRLLFVIHYPVFGGPHNQALRLDHALRERGWDQVVLLPDESGNALGRLREAGVEVRTTSLQRLRASPDPLLQLRAAAGFCPDVVRIRRLIRELDAELVMVGGVVNPHAAIAAHLEGIPLVWQIVDTRTPMTLRRVVMPLVERLADSVLCTGARVAAEHPGTANLGSRLISFFPPVNTQEFEPSPQRRARARAELGLEASDLVVGMVGNINPQKGQRTFVEAAAQLRQRQAGVRFVILGASYPQHADYAAGLRSRATELGLVVGRDLIVADAGDRVAELAPAFDISWLTSEPRSEGIPTVVGEAMSLGIPVVAADVGSVGEAVEDGVTGYVVPPRDACRMAELTDGLIRDPEVRRTIGENARQRAVSRFGIDRCADAHVEAFEVARDHAGTRQVPPMSLPRLGPDGPPEALPLQSVSVCPKCKGSLGWQGGEPACARCGVRYSAEGGVPVLLAPADETASSDTDAEDHKRRQMAFFDEEANPEYETSRPHGTPALHGWLLGEKYRRSVTAISKRGGVATALAVCGGSGLDAEFLARSGLSVVSADISLKAAQRALTRSRLQGVPITAVVADVEQLPFADRSFDLVYVHDGLHHLEDPLSGLREMTRVARRAVAVTEPAVATITKAGVRLGVALEYEDAGNRVARVEPGRLVAELEAQGFELRAMQRYVMYYRHEPGPVAHLLSRKRLRPAAQRAFLWGNDVFGQWGNKLALVAVRDAQPAPQG